MTERQWLQETYPQMMLAFLQMEDKASERKLFLFVCAAVRRVWPLLTDGRSRRAVEITEAQTDGLIISGGLQAAVSAAEKAAYRVSRAANQACDAWHAASVAQLAVERLEQKRATPAVQRAMEQAEQVARRATQRAEQLAARAEAARGEQGAARAAMLCIRASWYRSQNMPGAEPSLRQAVEVSADIAGDPAQEREVQCQLLRCIFGNVFRPLPSLDPGWLTWNAGVVRKLAEGIYDTRAFDRLHILADALEEAGCADADILMHCRQPGEHARGCWVIDLLLGKS